MSAVNGEHYRCATSSLGSGGQTPGSSRGAEVTRHQALPRIPFEVLAAVDQRRDVPFTTRHNTAPARPRTSTTRGQEDQHSSRPLKSGNFGRGTRSTRAPHTVVGYARGNAPWNMGVTLAVIRGSLQGTRPPPSSITAFARNGSRQLPDAT